MLHPQAQDPASASERSLLRQAPEVRTVCGSSARTDLRGEPPERAVPTATGPASRSHAPQGILSYLVLAQPTIEGVVLAHVARFLIVEQEIAKGDSFPAPLVVLPKMLLASFHRIATPIKRLLQFMRKLHHPVDFLDG